MSRALHEQSIKRIDTPRGGELESALTTLAFRHGLSWFTDEQIAEIRAEMVQTEWNRRCRQNGYRKQARAA